MTRCRAWALPRSESWIAAARVATWGVWAAACCWVRRARSCSAPAACAAFVTAVLPDMSPTAPCWTFDRDDRTAAFWRRRQLQEVSVHRWDVDQHEIDETIAEAGVDEVVDFFLPRQLALGRTTVPDGGLALVAPGKEWALLPGEPAARVEGAPADLNLLLWGRRTLDEMTVTGDAAFAAQVFAAALTP